MILYAETSAVLRWLLGQPDGERVRALLSGAERIVASHLTVLECERALSRLGNEAPAEERAAARELLVDAARHWALVEIDEPIRARAGQPFPVEPLRTLDAIHVATFVEVARALGAVHVLSTDDRVRRNAEALGLRVLPQ